MTATSPTPDPFDSLIYAVTFIRDQLDVAMDLMEGECEPAAELLDRLRDELAALLLPFGFEDLVRYVPLYSDRTRPFVDTEIRQGVTGREWRLPAGYAQHPVPDWHRLCPPDDDPKPRLRLVHPDQIDGSQS